MMVSIEAILPAMFPGGEKSLQSGGSGNFQSVLDQLLPPQVGNESLQNLPSHLQNLPPSPVATDSSALSSLPFMLLQQPADIVPVTSPDVVNAGMAGSESIATGGTSLNTAARLLAANRTAYSGTEALSYELPADVADPGDTELLTTVNKVMEQSRLPAMQDAGTSSAATYSMTSITSQKHDYRLPAGSDLPIMEADLAMNEPGWESGMEHRLKWMINQRVQHAEIRLSPRELGALDVSISMEGDAVRIHFNTASQATKELVEASLLRLQDALESDGLNLGHCSVDTGKDGSQQKFAMAAEQGMVAESMSTDQEAGPDSVTQAVISSSRLLNVFA